jgi:2-polyprenyl-6-methoxyphenol hydroxylase-like FAD-dependent oxidoreductase
MRIKRTDLVDVLMEAVNKAKIPVHFNKRLSAIDDNEDGVSVTFSDGTTDTADFLLGCDGIHSSVRRLYVNPDLVPEYSGFSGLGSIIPTSSLPPTAAAQLSGFDVTLIEEGVIMAMPCTATGDEMCWGLVRQVPLPDPEDSRDGWEVHRRTEVDEFKANLHKILANACGDWGAALRDIVDHTKAVQFYPIHRLPLGGAWSKGRCLLLGDAAHAMQPHAGQGVSMALEDAFLLSRLLEDPSRTPGEVYEQFDRIRRPRVTEIYQMAARNVGIRKKTGPWGLWAKEVAIRAALWAWSASGLNNWGIGQKHLVYDIDEESFEK